jgi:hypothetical protein
MTERNLRREMLEDLLVQRATEALDAAAETELATLLAEFPGTDALAYERAAAAVWLAAGPVRAAMPKALEERILAGARPAAPRP